MELAMKKYNSLTLLFVSTFLAVFSVSAAQTKNINGLWEDVNNEHFKNGHMIVSQDKDAIYITHYVEFKGLPLVEYGIGSRSGNTIEYKVKVTQAIPGWTTEGTHTLALSNDGTQLVGYYSSDGKTGPLKFKKIGK
ncbi:hypothetical protein PAUR_a1839 [Pseudoalteromonas aurantia 208]|uniref:Uncharacterized protein n=2 Tax=Pseudoalteromonas aurantia TaxID=43654 RepID=A0ABR9EBR5_9GAMM|nr:hypothetical protein [Pseudoalteromonas aurantia 208]